MKELEFIYRRRSIRKFKDACKPIPEKDIEEIIKAATYAPSGRNLQNWHFVVITNQRKINEIANIVERKNAFLTEHLTDEDEIKKLKASVAYHTLFREAPVLIMVYAGPYPIIADALLKSGLMPEEEVAEYQKTHPGIQNISAAMENLLLAATSLGYGTCWMTGPTYAAAEISEYIEFDKKVGKKGYHLAALTPLGIPAEDKGSNPPRKPLNEVITVID